MILIKSLCKIDRICYVKWINELVSVWDESRYTLRYIEVAGAIRNVVISDNQVAIQVVVGKITPRSYCVRRCVRACACTCVHMCVHTCARAACAYV